MGECNVPQDVQKRIMHGYMMQQMMVTRIHEEDNNGTAVPTTAPESPQAVGRLPGHLRNEMSTYLRIEAIRRRDAAFCHCSHEFLVAMVGSLSTSMILMTDDTYALERRVLPEQVALLVDGTMEVMREGKKHQLHVGDIVGKEWLGRESKTSATVLSKASIRAETTCTLITGLHKFEELQVLRERFPKDFSLLKANRVGVRPLTTQGGKSVARSA